MASLLSAVSNLAPYNLLLYSTLLGTELYQTFVMTKLTYNALPISMFRSLQKRVFPVYFRSQTSMIVLVALTVPPHGPWSLTQNIASYIALGIAGVTAALNLMVYGPATQEAMVAVTHQGRSGFFVACWSVVER
jgi:hypothetical protein